MPGFVWVGHGRGLRQHPAHRGSAALLLKGKTKVKVVDLYSDSTQSVSKALRYSMHCQGISQFYLHTLRFIRKRNEPYPPLSSHPQLLRRKVLNIFVHGPLQALRLPPAIRVLRDPSPLHPALLE